MPLVHHHRRRHSWPYCGPEAIEQPLFLAPLVREDLLEDDVSSAGIVRAASTTKAAVTETTRDQYFWPHLSRVTANVNGDYLNGKWNASSLAASAPAKSGRSRSFRQMLRPSLHRARSWFVVSTTASNPAREKALVSFGYEPLPPRGGPALLERGRPVNKRVRGLGAGEEHRRSHSEQPRSWRKPSESLWTLSEE